MTPKDLQDKWDECFGHLHLSLHPKDQIRGKNTGTEKILDSQFNHCFKTRHKECGQVLIAIPTPDGGPSPIQVRRRFPMNNTQQHYQSYHQNGHLNQHLNQFHQHGTRRNRRKT